MNWPSVYIQIHPVSMAMSQEKKHMLLYRAEYHYGVPSCVCSSQTVTRQ